MNEVWNELPNIKYFADIVIEKYLVSNTGKVMIKETGKILKIFYRYGKLPVVPLSRRSVKEHRIFSLNLLVMLAFDYRPDFKNLWVVNLDCDTRNANLDNLMWSDGYKFGRLVMLRPRFDPFAFTVNNVYPQEVWLPLPWVKEFEGIRCDWYLISSYGRVFSNYLCREIIPSISGDGAGYYNIELTGDNDVHKSYRVSRLVALTFKYIENSEYYQVNHINGNTRDNFVGNLEWVLPIENTHHAFMNNLSVAHLGENNNTATVANNTVFAILDGYVSGISIDQLAINFNQRKEYIEQVINCNTRKTNIINFILSKGYNNIKDCFSDIELQLLIDNANLDLKSYKRFINTIGIMNNTIKFLAAILVKRFVNNPNDWYSKMYFYGASYYLNNN